MAKKAWGEGSIYKRSDGRYEIAVVDRRSGKRARAYASSPKEAEAKREEMAARARKKKPLVDSPMRLDKYVDSWLEGRAGRRRRPSTVREYERRLRSYVIPALGHTPLRDLTSLDVENLMDGLKSRGLSSSTICGTRNALAAVLTDAMKVGDLQENVARSAELPELAEPARASAPQHDQVSKLLAVSMDTEYEALIHLVVFTFCRPSEALAAKWADIDLEVGQWDLRRTLTVDRQGAPVLGERTKSGDARIVVLVEPLVGILREQRARVRRLRLKAGPAWTDHDLVFPSSIGTPLDSHNVRSRLRPLLRKAGITGGLRSLRHFGISAAASAGVPMPIVSKSAGHQRQSTTTDVYQHLFPRDASEVANAVSSAVIPLLPTRDSEQRATSEGG